MARAKRPGGNKQGQPPAGAPVGGIQPGPSQLPVVPEMQESARPSQYQNDVAVLIRELEEIRGSNVIALVAAPDVILDQDIVANLYQVLHRLRHRDRLDLFLHSTGGRTEVPWRLITLLRDYCDSLGVLVPHMAHSAATQIALGANEIVMGPLSELTPVDPARGHPLLPAAPDGTPLRVSVQDLKHFVEFVKTSSVRHTAQSLSAIYCGLIDKVHPLAIGAIEQSYALGKLITHKVLATHMDPDSDKELIDKIADALSDSFKSHQYRIGWKEAAELGLKVTRADSDLWEVMCQLLAEYEERFAAPMSEPHADLHVARPIVWIDSRVGGACLTEHLSFRAGPNKQLECARKAQWSLFVSATESES